MKKNTKTQEPGSVENLIFETLAKIGDAIAKTFPRNMEVVVHDLSNPQQSIRAIAGDVTKRKIGGPITDLVVKALHREGSRITDRFNYKTITGDGRELKSSTVFIRNLEGEVIGAFCINFDMTDYLNAALAIDVFTRTAVEQDADEKLETFAASFPETINALFKEAVAKIGKQCPSMSRKEKLSLIRELEQNGVFQLKGAVDEIAVLMGVSKYTIYNYLKQIKTMNGLNLV